MKTSVIYHFINCLEGSWLQHNQHLFCVSSTVSILSCPHHKPILFIVTYCKQCPKETEQLLMRGNIKSGLKLVERSVCMRKNWKQWPLPIVCLTRGWWLLHITCYPQCASLCLCMQEDAMPNSIVKYCRWMLPRLTLHDSRCFLSGWGKFSIQ